MLIGFSSKTSSYSVRKAVKSPYKTTRSGSSILYIKLREVRGTLPSAGTAECTARHRRAPPVQALDNLCWQYCLYQLGIYPLVYLLNKPSHQSIAGSIFFQAATIAAGTDGAVRVHAIWPNSPLLPLEPRYSCPLVSSDIPIHSQCAAAQHVRPHPQQNLREPFLLS